MTRGSNTALLLVLPLTFCGVLARGQDFTYTVTNGTVRINFYTGPGGDVTIPATINGLPVTEIGGDAFSGNQNVNSITIPYSVTNIDGLIFTSCVSLSTVVVDQRNPSYSSLNGVLFNKDQTELIQFPYAAGTAYIRL